MAGINLEQGLWPGIMAIAGASIWVFRIVHRVGRIEEKIDNMNSSILRMELRTDEILLRMGGKK